jgi:4-amino-4-deoxy-L-arabinose transferase-like glycosyltransferase
MERITDLLWGHRARFLSLFLASIFLLFTLLGTHEIWTQEHRWADVVSGMFFRRDFLHPYLNEQAYYDKPLLSYWLIVWMTYLIGALNTWALRLPSALAGLLAIWSIYRLGTVLKNKQLGLLSGWLLLTTFYFVFWARISSADMLNVGGSLYAIAWYMSKRDDPRWRDYAYFFIILAVTALCKGLTGVVVPLLAVLTDMVLRRSIAQYLSWKGFVAMLPAVVIYLLPFLASSYWGGGSYEQNGLYLVYRENLLRYIHPFDHQGSIYTYFIYLPIYLIPTSIFFFSALWRLPSRWQTLAVHSRWIVWTLLLVFLFFTLSGSRRPYYVLPMVPFAILLAADDLLSLSLERSLHRMWVTGTILFSYALLFLVVVFLPWRYYAQYGDEPFALLLKQEVNKIKPWAYWEIVMLDAESKLSFYLQLPPQAKRYSIEGKRDPLTITKLKQSWPILVSRRHNMIFISRRLYEPMLRRILVGYRVIVFPSRRWIPFFTHGDENLPIAFIPT